MVPGIKNGEILRGPPLIIARCSRSITSNPPIPEPMCTPTRSAFSGVICNPGMLHCFLRGGKSEMDEAPHFARFLFIDELQRIEVFDLSRERNGESRCVEAGDRSHSTLGRPADFPRSWEQCCRFRTSARSRSQRPVGSNHLLPFAFFSMYSVASLTVFIFSASSSGISRSNASSELHYQFDHVE